MPIPTHANHYMVIADFASDGTPEAKHWTNTLFFENEGTPVNIATAADQIKVLLDKFYGQVNAPGTQRLSLFMSSRISTADSRWKVYDLGQPAPRTPELRTVSISTVDSGQPLPNEVAAVLSYRGDAGGSGGGTLNKRKRGRLYLGPLGQTCVTTSVGVPDAILTSSLVNALRGAGDYLRDQSDNDMVWNQYSRIADDFSPVTGGFVNNAPDTQRRRGYKGNSRSTW